MMQCKRLQERYDHVITQMCKNINDIPRGAMHLCELLRWYGAYPVVYVCIYVVTYDTRFTAERCVYVLRTERYTITHIIQHLSWTVHHIPSGNNKFRKPGVLGLNLSLLAPCTSSTGSLTQVRVLNSVTCMPGYSICFLMLFGGICT